MVFVFLVDSISPPCTLSYSLKIPLFFSATKLWFTWLSISTTSFGQCFYHILHLWIINQSPPWANSYMKFLKFQMCIRNLLIVYLLLVQFNFDSSSFFHNGYHTLFHFIFFFTKLFVNLNLLLPISNNYYGNLTWSRF